MNLFANYFTAEAENAEIAQREVYSDRLLQRPRENSDCLALLAFVGSRETAATQPAIKPKSGPMRSLLSVLPEVPCVLRISGTTFSMLLFISSSAKKTTLYFDTGPLCPGGWNSINLLRPGPGKHS